ncbi:Cytochrome P450 26A1 [Manis pentadactyla]|nr:Cytochrome P450 26A1 [Manis pentadactyla]
MKVAVPSLPVVQQVAGTYSLQNEGSAWEQSLSFEQRLLFPGCGESIHDAQGVEVVNLVEKWAVEDTYSEWAVTVSPEENLSLQVWISKGNWGSVCDGLLVTPEAVLQTTFQ